MHLHDVILDIYDDPTVTVLRSKLAGAEMPPELGESIMLTPEKMASMPDHLFALVAVNGDDTVRKYAMHNAAHVTTSVLYLLEQGHLLPEGVQKIAARNLVGACGWYGMEPPPELVKRAGVVGAAFGALDVAGRLGDTMAKNQSTMDGFRAAQAGATSDMQAQKTADLNGTEMMPMSGSLSTWPLPRNTARAPSASPGTKMAKWMHAGDLTGHQAREKTAAASTRFAMPSISKYPLDSYSEVKTASAYFEEHVEAFTPEERREFAVNLVERQEALGMRGGESAMKYAGHSYGPNIQVELHARMRNYEGTGHDEGYGVLIEKFASIPPHVMVDMLHELDSASGADTKYAAPLGFRDPFQAVYGKVAADAAGESPSWSWTLGNEYVTDRMLKEFAEKRYLTLDTAFGEDMRRSFQKDPVGVFKSLPDPQKTVVARLASHNT